MYNLTATALTSLTLTSALVNVGDEAQVIFNSGSTATTIVASNTVFWFNGDNTSQGEFNTTGNKKYFVRFKKMPTKVLVIVRSFE